MLRAMTELLDVATADLRHQMLTERSEGLAPMIDDNLTGWAGSR